MADIAVVRAAGANGRAIREKEEIRIRSDLVSAFCAFKAVDMEE